MLQLKWAWLAIAVVACALSACTVQLVAPYNSELAQRASSMQAEVAAWDLQMRGGAGTILSDPRHPDLIAALNRWRGEAEAMLTLAIANDPGTVNCGEAVKAVSSAIESRVAARLGTTVPSVGAAGRPASPARGCETELVAAVASGIDDIEKALKYCRLEWVGDAYFAELAQQRLAPRRPPPAPNPEIQDRLRRSCFAEFRPSPAEAAQGLPGARQGRAVSGLSTTLQSIVYVESRKRAALLSR